MLTDLKELTESVHCDINALFDSLENYKYFTRHYSYHHKDAMHQAIEQAILAGKNLLEIINKVDGDLCDKV